MVGNKLGIYDGEVLGITLVVLDISKLRWDELSGQVLSGGKFQERSIVDLLWMKVGTEVCPCGGNSDGGDLGNIVVGSWTKKVCEYPLVESLGEESRVKGGFSGDI